MTARIPPRPLWERNSCPACGSLAEPKQVYKKWGYPIRRCPDCGLGSTSIGAFDPATIYSTEYFTGGRKDGYADYVGSELILRKESRKVLRGLARAGRKSGRLLEIGSAYGFFSCRGKRYI